MSHPLQQRVAALRRGARALLLAHAACWCCATTLAAAALLAVGDYALRLQSPWARGGATLLLLAVVAWSLVRYLLPVFAWRPTSVQIARRVERRRPELGGRLASAVEFIGGAEQADVGISAELRQAVVEEASDLTREIRFTDCLDARAARVAAVACVLTVAVVAALAWSDRQAAAVAVRRLTAPWGVDQWPRRHHLAFKNPPVKIAAGDDLTLEVADERGRLPQEVYLQVWFDGDPATEIRRQKMQLQNGAMVRRLENVEAPLKFRAFGGDDDTMQWKSLGVEQPPKIVSLEIQLAPPVYTGWPAQAAGLDFDALRGTRVAVSAKTDRPLRSVRLRAGDSDLPAEIDVADDGLGFELKADGDPPWKLEQSGSYWFEIIDDRGLAGGRTTRIDVRTIDDAPPRVSIEDPQNGAQVLSSATVRIRAQVQDDVGIETIELVYRRSDQPEADQQRISIVAQGSPAAADSALPAGFSSPGVNRRVEYDWSLSPMAVEPGVELAWRIAATDLKGQQTESEDRRIVVVTPQQFSERVADREAEIHRQLAAALDAARQASSGAAAVSDELAAAAPRRAHLNRLHAADRMQHDLGRNLAFGDESTLGRVVDLLRDVESHGAGDAKLIERLRGIGKALEGLAADQLPAIESGLAAAIKSLRGALDNDATPLRIEKGDALAALRHAGGAQDALISVLARLVGRLSHRESVRQLAADVGQVRQDQHALREETNRLRSATLARRFDELDAEDQAALRAAAQQQTQLALAMDGILQRLRAAGEVLAQGDAAAAGSVAGALDRARSGAIGGKMRDSAQHLKANRVGQAGAAQDEILTSLDQVRQLLSGPPTPSDSEHIHNQLQTTVQQAAALQQALLEETVGLDESRQALSGREIQLQTAALAARQVELAEQVRELASQVSGETVFSASLSEAAAEMASAGQGLAAQATGAPTLRAQKNALAWLQRIASSLEAAAQQASSSASTGQDSAAPPPDGREGQRPRLSAAELRLIQAIQVDVLQRTRELDASSRRDGWSADERRSQNALAGDQGRLADWLLHVLQEAAQRGGADTNNTQNSQAPKRANLSQDLLEGLNDAPADGPSEGDPESPRGRLPEGEDIGDESQLPLARIAQQMAAAQARIARGDVSPATQATQEAIVSDLQALLSQLKQQSPSGGAAASSTEQERANGQSPRQGDSTTATEAVAPPPANVDASVKQIWGTLPPEVREQVINGGFSELLPEYAEMIQDYYRRLAERESRR